MLRTLVRREEVAGVARLVAVSPQLCEVQLRRGATDQLLETLGSCCPQLREINMLVTRDCVTV